MFDSLYQIINEMIPAVSSESLKAFKDDFKKYQFDSNVFVENPQESIIQQGDILKDIEFKITASSGESKTKRTYGMLLSHSCDYANRKKYILFALCIPANEYQQSLSNFTEAKNQGITQLMFIPTSHILGDDLIVDFSIISTIHSNAVGAIIGRNHLMSLKELGHFLFLTKLTIHFFRTEE